MASQDTSHNNMDGGANQPPVKTTPKDALVMTSILKEMGVNEYEPRVVNQMVEFAYRYITDIVEDSRVYCQHANRKTLNLDDVKLAVSQKLDHSFTSPPPREFLLEIARSKNALPLPLIADRSGLRLPPERYCLTGNNYKVKAPPKKSQQQQRKQSTAKASVKAGSSTAQTNTTSSTAKIMLPQATLSQIKQEPSSSQNAMKVDTANVAGGGVFQQPQMYKSSNLKRKHEDDDYDT